MSIGAVDSGSMLRGADQCYECLLVVTHLELYQFTINVILTLRLFSQLAYRMPQRESFR